MADTAVTFVVNKMGEVASDTIERLAEVGDDMILLRDKLEWLETFLRDADQKRRQRNNDYMDVWVRQTRDVAFDVEDMLDDFFFKFDVRCNGWLDLAGCWDWLKHRPARLYLRRTLSERIKTIKMRLEVIADLRKEYNLEDIPSTWTPPNYIAWSKLEADAEELVGFQHHVREVKHKLLNSHNGRVISIVGDCGFGKTILARTIYKDRKINDHFETLAWIHVPQMFEPRELKLTISNLAHRVLGKRYLVVLDNVRSIEDWCWFQDVIPSNKTGSKLLITSRLDLREKVDSDNDVVVIESLDNMQSEELFCRKVFGENELPCGKKGHWGRFLKKMKGVPLAIVMLAGLLRSKERANWDDVINRLIPKKEKTANATTRAKDKPEKEWGKCQEVEIMHKKRKIVEKMFLLSLDDLPPHLKPCFLYFTAFKEGSIVDAKKLVRLWVAEGFIQLKEGQTMEELGQSYLKELISRCLIELVEKDPSDNVVKVSFNDCLASLAKSEALETGFLEVQQNNNLLYPATVRRLSLQKSINKYVFQTQSTPKLRSFLCDIVEEPVVELASHYGKLKEMVRSLTIKNLANFNFHASKFLRVIDLQGVKLTFLPVEIRNMTHLKYLGLACTGLKHLPSSISKLRYLQTLDISDDDVDKIDDEFWKIQTLRHVLTKKLLAPKKVGFLLSMQTLHGLQWGKWVWKGNAVVNMTNLRSLKLWDLKKHDKKALSNALENLDHLVSLELEGEELPSSVFTTLTLRHLQNLKLCGEIEKEMQAKTESDHHLVLPSLTKISLSSSKVVQEVIHVLSRLSKLVELVLGKDSYVSDELLVPVKSFANLKKLEIAHLNQLRLCTIGEHAMLGLAHLSISHCPNLAMLPEGLQQLRNLKELVLHDMPAIVARIHREGEDYHKIEHVPIVRKNKMED